MTLDDLYIEYCRWYGVPDAERMPWHIFLGLARAAQRFEARETLRAFGAHMDEIATAQLQRVAYPFPEE